VLAAALFCLAVAETLATVVAGMTAGMSWTAGDNVLVVTNTINGFALVVAGWPIAAYRPRNPIGWQPHLQHLRQVASRQPRRSHRPRPIIWARMTPPAGPSCTVAVSIPSTAGYDDDR